MKWRQYIIYTRYLLVVRNSRGNCAGSRVAHKTRTIFYHSLANIIHILCTLHMVKNVNAFEQYYTKHGRGNHTSGNGCFPENADDDLNLPSLLLLSLLVLYTYTQIVGYAYRYIFHLSDISR